MLEPIEYSIEPSNDKGFPTIGINQSGRIAYVHSRMSPARESSSLKERIESIKQDTVIVFGSGLGYSLEPIKYNGQIRKVIIIERLPGIEKHINMIFTNPDNCEYLYLSGLDFDILESKLSDIIDLTSINSIAFIDHPASLRLFTDYYSSARKVVDKVIHSKIGNAATLKSFSASYLRNAIKSVADFPGLFPVSSLSGLCKAYSCALISSAPSIDHFIDIIKKYDDRILILAVDSAYPVCRAHGIIPDLIISVDPQPWTEEHLIDIDGSIPILSSVTSHLRHSDRSFISLNSHPLSQIIEHFHPLIGSVDSHTGTVAGDAIKTALLMGAKRLYLAGLDFSFPRHIIYSRDSAYNHRYAFIYNNRLNSVETHHERYIRKSSSGTSVDGIRTRKSFIQYRDSISSLINDTGNCEFIHLSHGGLSIPGTRAISTREETSAILDKEEPIISKSIFRQTLDTIVASDTPDTVTLRRIFSDTSLTDQAIKASLGDTFSDVRLNKSKLLLHKLLGTI